MMIFNSIITTIATLAAALALHASPVAAQITNIDDSLIVPIDPLLRITLFQTSEILSDEGVAAFALAASDFATPRMFVYFVSIYGPNEYIFDNVKFQVLEVQRVTRGTPTRRNLRVFEREEARLIEEYEYRQQSEIEEGHGAGPLNSGFTRINKVRHVEMGDSRDLQAIQYGTSFLLTGNFTFGALPAAPAAECNQKLANIMTKYWGFMGQINALNRADLTALDGGIFTEILDPTQSPTVSPSKPPTESPSHPPTASPSLKPSKPPTSKPTGSPTNEPSQTPTTSHVPNYTPAPTNIASSSPSLSPSVTQPGNGNGNGANRPTGGNDMLFPIVFPSMAAVILALGALFVVKRRRDQKNTLAKSTLLQHHAKLRGDDFDDSDDDGGSSDDHLASVGLASTKELESGGSSDAELGESQKSPQSVATNETMKASNVPGAAKRSMSMENTWVKNPSPSKFTSTTVGIPRSYQKPPVSPMETFPVKLDRSICSESESLMDDGSPASRSKGSSSSRSSSRGTPKRIPQSSSRGSTPKRAVAVMPTVSPAANLFGKVESDGIAASSPKNRSIIRKNSVSSPITSVTASKVSKEEFENEWDVDLPFNWNPTPTKSAKKKSRDKKKTPRSDSREVDIEGSFPTFDMADEPPINIVDSSTVGGSTGQSLQSIGDSSVYKSENDMHTLDWSNKGSEYDGTSSVGGDSTITDGDNTKSPEPPSQWEGRMNNVMITESPMSGSEQYMTPRSQLTRRTNTPHTFSSGLSRHAYSDASSPTSSRGSSKQLIHDLVWLEKKIADVRARVDRLDGDESHTTGSPPMSPDSIGRPVGSPISANIICRDVFAPPGRLQIVIHSTKDGPSIHSVKPGSILEGKLFAGDLIVSVNDTDTREFSAEDIMDMMAHSSSSERKLTVLHAA